MGMMKEINKVLAGIFFWNYLKLRDQLNYSKVVLVLTGENKDVDKYALIYLDAIIRRRNVKEAIIYALNDEAVVFAKTELHSAYPVIVKKVKPIIIECIYKRYTMEKFYKNIFWTYTYKTANNLIGRFMLETEINAEDVVCLAIYNLRQIPDGVKN